MEKGEFKTGQLMGVKEKNGRLVQEYVAGFFGDEPIIKQRLLSPQEARRYREDLERAKKQGKSQSEAIAVAGAGGAAAPKRKLVRRTKPGEGGAPVKKRRIKKISAVAREGEGEAPVRRRAPGSPAVAEAAPRGPQMAYVPEQSDSNNAFIQQLVDGETEKPNYNPANTAKAIEAISKISCPEMKIYRIGQDGDNYSQKEYIARNILGLPIWKDKVEEPEKKEEEETKDSSEETAVVEVKADSPQESTEETQESADAEVKEAEPQEA